MINAARLSLIGIVFLLGACAHPVTITPKFEISSQPPPPIQKSIAYLISQEDRDREVTTPGGGGDLVSYFPYRDLESGIFQVLSSVYSRVTLIRTLNDRQTLDKNNASLVFVPRITTDSSSGSAFTWPPTAFSVTIDYLAQDLAGKPVYKNTVIGQGRASFSEFSGEFGYAGRMASEDAMRRLKAQILNAPELK